MDQIIQDISSRPWFWPAIVITAIIIVAIGLLIYKLVEKINRPRAEITYRFIEGFGWVYENKEKEINVRELCREFQREGFCEGFSDQPEDDQSGSDEETAEEDQERALLPEKD